MSPLESNVTPDPSPLSVWICTTSGCVALTTATYCASRPAADDGEAEEVPLAEVIVVWSCLNHRSLSPGRDGMFAGDVAARLGSWQSHRSREFWFGRPYLSLPFS